LFSVTIPAIMLEPPAALPHIVDLHHKTDLDQTRILDYLFEPSPAIHDLLLPVIRTAEYDSYDAFVDACEIRLLSLAAAAPEPGPKVPQANATGVAAAASITSLPAPELLAVLGSHPRLGAKKIESAASAAEQANIQQGAEPGEAEELARLNNEYEHTFPGLRYVVFVNGRGRGEIMKDMRARIKAGDYTKEVAAAIQAMSDIAKDRASKKPVMERGAK
jgi:2-oxo-4-hydroxy-4-carboxy--5-ureidoimidazoline (OHCU) decarboxylase